MFAPWTLTLALKITEKQNPQRDESAQAWCKTALPACLMLRDFARDLSCHPTPPWCPVLLGQGSYTAYLPGDLLGVCGDRTAAEMLSSDSPRSVPLYTGKRQWAGVYFAAITPAPAPTVTALLWTSCH